MKKIKLLRIIVLILLLSHVIQLLYIVFNVPSKLIVTILISTPILFLIGLIFVERGLWIIIKNGYFNDSGIKKFKYAGYFLISSGFLSLIKSTFQFFELRESTELAMMINQKIAYNFCVLIIGLGILILSDMIKKGFSIQQENDLTV